METINNLLIERYKWTGIKITRDELVTALTAQGIKADRKNMFDSKLMDIYRRQGWAVSPITGRDGGETIAWGFYTRWSD